MPIPSALIVFDGNKVSSDNRGFFSVFGSCDGNLEITKDGYKPFIIKIIEGGEKTEIVIDRHVKYKDPKKPPGIDSSTYFASDLIYLNSTRFEYNDTLKVYLTTNSDE